MGWLFKRNGLIFTQVLRVFYRRPNGANRIKKDGSKTPSRAQGGAIKHVKLSTLGLIAKTGGRLRRSRGLERCRPSRLPNKGASNNSVARI